MVGSTHDDDQTRDTSTTRTVEPAGGSGPSDLQAMREHLASVDDDYHFLTEVQQEERCHEQLAFDADVAVHGFSP